MRLIDRMNEYKNAVRSTKDRHWREFVRVTGNNEPWSDVCRVRKNRRKFVELCGMRVNGRETRKQQRC